MNKAFYKKIINLIPSDDMKNYVFATGFQFREKDLLKIILNYAPSFEHKLKLFEEASRLLDDKSMRVLAKKRIAFENRQYNAFMQLNSDTVYQIEIKTDPNVVEDEETYLTKTFDDAIILIRDYIKCYDIKAKERVYARYTIEKKTTNLPNKPSDIYNDKVGTLGKCVLDSRFRILYLDMYNFGIEVACKKSVDCEECDRCINNMFSTRFPHFLKQYDLVAYYDDLVYNPKHLTYGIFDFDMEECDCDSHVIAIEDNPYITNRNGDFQENGYYRIYDAHDHPSCFEIIKPELKDVPQEIIDGYNYALPILKKIAQIRE